ncbi:MAG: NAD(P)H-dependent oxidoreductase [Gammaproteobacteria bacterium]|nr:NAD(P)H-dependent oxidoreductase [Gammaproteobacteria bacterium]
MKLLHIDSSILGEGSASRVLSREIVASFKAQHPHAEVTYRDLARHQLPHLSAQSLGGADPAETARNAAVLEEFLAADVLVIGAPVYNFSVPSQLKAWIDRIAVAGKTFRYTAAGPEGLARGKQAIIAIARGGPQPPGSAEFAEGYLRHLLQFLGVHEVRAVRAQGLALAGDSRAQVLRRALEEFAPALPQAA